MSKAKKTKAPSAAEDMKKNKRLDLRTSNHMLYVIDELCRLNGITKRATLIDHILVKEAIKQGIL